MGKEIGIDLGTTNTVVSYVNKNGHLKQLRYDGNEIIPSVIYFRSADEYFIGGTAQKFYQLNPQAGVANFKTTIGNNERHEIIPDEGKPFFKRSREIAQLFLNKIVVGMEEKLIKEFGAAEGYIDRAVITVPAKFSSTEKGATKKAAHSAGLSKVKLAAEPTAAAVAYEDSQGDDNSRAVILIYDFGGGTFDVSIIQKNNGAFEEITTGGDKTLGGNILTNILVAEILNRVNEDYGVEFPLSEDEFDEDYHGISLPDYLMNMYEIRRVANLIKEELSSNEDITEGLNINLPNDKSQVVEVNFSRDELEEYIREYIERTVEITVQEIRRAKDLGFDRIDQIVLAGGSSNIPLVKNLLEEALQNQEVIFCDDVSTLISRGAALLANHEVETPSVTNVEMGVAATEGIHFERFQMIIPANVPLPCTKKKIFYLSQDNQRRLEIEYYERDIKNFPNASRTDDDGIEQIDSLVIDNLPPNLRAGNTLVEVEFTAQRDGSLDINVLLKDNCGNEISSDNMTFEKKSNLE